MNSMVVIPYLCYLHNRWFFLQTRRSGFCILIEVCTHLDIQFPVKYSLFWKKIQKLVFNIVLCSPEIEIKL